MEIHLEGLRIVVKVFKTCIHRRTRYLDTRHRLAGSTTSLYMYYVCMYVLRGFKTPGDAFRLPYSIAFDCSIRPF
jgi:hypothetical protein